MKELQSKVSYRDRPNGKDRCGRCTMFRPPQGCTAVQGEISPLGWCKLFEAKP